MNEEKTQLHAVLFDGHAVYHALSPRARLRTSPENVADVLDAVVHLMKSASPSVNEEKTEACRAEQRGPSEWVCDCAGPGPNCKPTRADGVALPHGGQR